MLTWDGYAAAVMGTGNRYGLSLDFQRRCERLYGGDASTRMEQ